MTLTKTVPLTRLDQICTNVVHYGRNKETLDELIGIVNKDDSCSLILRGDARVGKKTLVKESARISNAKYVCLSSTSCSDDFNGLRRIAHKLGLNPKDNIPELLKSLENYPDKVVVVLDNFGAFARKRQSLLYHLTTLVQHGKCFKLIGITTDPNCTENLEKRVRSRLHARFMNVELPFESADEYVEFVSLVGGGVKFEKGLKQLLKDFYRRKERHSMRDVTDVLLDILEPSKNGLVVKDLDDIHFESPETVALRQTKIVLDSLTKGERIALLMATYITYAFEDPFFTWNKIEDEACRRNAKNFHTAIGSSKQVLQNLCDASLFLPLKQGTEIDQDTPICLGITGDELGRIWTNDDVPGYEQYLKKFLKN